jgi:hypothetical protein
MSNRNKRLPTIRRKAEILFQKKVKNRRILPLGLYIGLILTCIL